MASFRVLMTIVATIHVSYAWTSMTDGGMVGTTYASGTVYNVGTLCPNNVNQGYMCDGRNVGNNYLNPDTVSAFCSGYTTFGNSNQYGFGHGVTSTQKCGECAQIRVPKIDGTYNYMTVMMVDVHTYSMEVGTTEMQKLVDGTQWVLGDRADFDYRIVDCYASFDDDDASNPSPVSSPTPAPSVPTTPTTPPPVSSECGVSSNWGSMTISPYWGSDTTQISAIIRNAPSTITSVEMKGYGQTDSQYKSCVIQNIGLNMWQCEFSSALTEPASIRLNNGAYIGNNIIKSMTGSTAEYPLSSCSGSTPSTPSTPASPPTSTPRPTSPPTPGSTASTPATPPVSSSGGCSVSSNWGSIGIRPHPGSTTTQFWAHVENSPSSISKLEIKGYGESNWRECTRQNVNFFVCSFGGQALTEPASIRLDGSYYGINIVESMSDYTQSYSRSSRGCTISGGFAEEDDDSSDGMEWTIIFAIVMGCLIGIGLIITGFVCLYKYNKKKKGSAYFEDNVDTAGNDDIGDGDITKTEIA